MKKKETLICKCKKIDIQTKTASLMKECSCKAPLRKEREFSQVIIETKEEN